MPLFAAEIIKFPPGKTNLVNMAFSRTIEAHPTGKNTKLYEFGAWADWPYQPELISIAPLAGASRWWRCNLHHRDWSSIFRGGYRKP